MDNPISLPYNFVSLPDVVLHAEELPDRTYFNTGRKTGVITCSLTALSPVFVAGEQKGEFFHHGNPDDPVIPGSSLRGMIRSIVQVITWSKLQPVTKKKMFLRDLKNPEDYMDFFKNGVHAGFLRKKGGGYELEPCIFFKVSHDQMLGALKSNETDQIDKDLKRNVDEWKENGRPLADELKTIILDWRTSTNTLSDELKTKLSPWLKERAKWLEERAKRKFFPVDPKKEGINTYPGWDYQNKTVWIQTNIVGEVTSFAFVTPTNPAGWIQGILVMTGWMKGKKHEYVFVEDTTATPFTEPYITELVQELESDDQITDWQKHAFDKDKPKPQARREKGLIRKDEPVFFIMDEKIVRFLGRARLFRLPYGKAPYELLPETHRDTEQIDMTEAIFGFVEKDKAGKKPKSYAVKGRVSFSDARYEPQESVSLWLHTEAFAPKILAAPKPASYTTYLQQPQSQGNAATAHGNVSPLKKYSSGDAQLRGQKFYWHQVKVTGGQVKPLGYDELKLLDKKPNFDQCVNPLAPGNHAIFLPETEVTNFDQRVKPLAPGVKFSFSVRFDNLTDNELGALLWALTLPGTEHLASAHKLGMGKAIGMGSVKIDIDSLDMLDLSARYQSLDNTGFSVADPQGYINTFCEYMETTLNIKKFGEHPRIRDLRLLLNVPGMKFEGVSYKGFAQYKDHPILISVQDAYTQYHAPKPPSASSASSTSASAQPLDPTGTLIRGTVIEIAKNGQITYLVKDTTDDIAVVEPENLAGKQGVYKEDMRIKAMCLRVEVDKAGDLTYYCTLDYPKDLK